MTQEEIKNLIKQYAKGTETKHFSAELIESIVMGFYTSRLIYEYCIVPKSKVMEEYNYYKNSWNKTELTETTMESFENIFGTELFNNEKK